MRKRELEKKKIYSSPRLGFPGRRISNYLETPSGYLTCLSPGTRTHLKCPSTLSFHNTCLPIPLTPYLLPLTPYPLPLTPYTLSFTYPFIQLTLYIYTKTPPPLSPLSVTLPHFYVTLTFTR